MNKQFFRFGYTWRNQDVAYGPPVGPSWRKGSNPLINNLKLCISGVDVPAVYRGTVLFLGAILSLLFIDHDEGQLHPGDSHLFSNISSWLGFADHKVM
jgi:hypothetical protein